MSDLIRRDSEKFMEVKTIFNEERKKILKHDSIFARYEVMGIVDDIAEKLEKCLSEMVE